MPRTSTVAAPRPRPLRWSLAALVAAVLGVLLAAPAGADDQGNRAITSYEVSAVAHEDGTIDVQTVLHFDFADTPGHGPLLTYVTRQEIEGDPDHYRVLEITDVTASSPSGAPADVRVETDDAGLAVYVGDPDVDDVSGVQVYVVSFTIAGVPSSGVGASGEDEIYWNVLGSASDIPIGDMRVSVTGPQDPLEIDCRVGAVGSPDRCESMTADGRTASFAQPRLDEGEGMSVIVSYPPDTFGGVQPILEPRRTFANSLGFDSAPALGAAGVLAVLGLGAVGARARQRGRDQQYLGLTPGVAPAAGAEGRTGPRRKAPVAVRFTPPDGVRPGEVGTLTDEVADPHDVTATIIDLAVRGYLRIEEIEPADGEDAAERDWRLVRVRDDWTGLTDVESTLMRGIFPHSAEASTTLGELKTTFASTLAAAQQDLYASVVGHGWFRESPHRVRTRWVGGGVALILVGLVGALVLGLTAGLAVLGIPFVLVGILLVALNGTAPARTADGTAVLAQALGFKRYLEKAEANQIRFEEGEDLFSRYLPYAIAFGVADRWAAVFAELAAQGHDVPVPGWYVGHHAMAGAVFWSGGFTEGITAFDAAAQIAVAAPTPGSSGGSGFSSGGGFSGGGVGGGGASGW